MIHHRDAEDTEKTADKGKTRGQNAEVDEADRPSHPRAARAAEPFPAPISSISVFCPLVLPLSAVFSVSSVSPW